MHPFRYILCMILKLYHFQLPFYKFIIHYFSTMLSKFSIVLFLMLVHASTFSQDILVKGVIKSLSGYPLEGIMVYETGETIGSQTVSNPDGSYSISAKKDRTLVFVYMGKYIKYVPVNLASNDTIKLDVKIIKGRVIGSRPLLVDQKPMRIYVGVKSFQNDQNYVGYNTHLHEIRDPLGRFILPTINQEDSVTFYNLSLEGKWQQKVIKISPKEDVIDIGVVKYTFKPENVLHERIVRGQLIDNNNLPAKNVEVSLPGIASNETDENGIFILRWESTNREKRSHVLYVKIQAQYGYPMVASDNDYQYKEIKIRLSKRNKTKDVGVIRENPEVRFFHEKVEK
jgi:hypothetical protein